MTATPDPAAERWEIPRSVWFTLLGWGLAVLVLAGLFAWWTQRVEQENDRQAAEAKRQQDVAMCDLFDLFTSGPEPVAGPAGDRGRVVLAAMRAYESTLHCDQLRHSGR